MEDSVSSPLEEHTGFEPALTACARRKCPWGRRPLCYRCTNAPYNRRSLLPAGRLSELSCVTDFRIATVFTLRRSRSFPAVSQQIETGGFHFGIAADGGQGRNRTGILPLCCGCAYLKSLPAHIGINALTPEP